MSEVTKKPTASVAGMPVSWGQRLAALSPKQRQLAEMRLREQGIDLSLIEISPRSPDLGNLPLSFAQQRLWFLHQLEPESVAYNLIGALRLEGELEVQALQAAYGELSRRHEMLRTTFATEEGLPVQIIHPRLEPALPLVDLSGLGEGRREVLSQRLVTRHTQRPFDLARGPLMRFALFRLGARVHALSQSMHHIVSDAWSMDIFRRELLLLYRGLSAQPALSAGAILSPPKLQYGDFAVWQRNWLQGKVLDRQLDYWKGKLGGGVPVLELSTDRPRAAEGSFLGGQCVLLLPPKVVSTLDQIGGEEKTTRFVMLCCLFEALLWRHTGQDDFTIGSTIAGRNRRETEELIGFFINTRVLRADFAGNPSYRQALRRVRQVVLEAEEHQDLPFERLVEELAPERSLQRPPLFQVTFTFLQRGKDPAASEGGARAHSGLAVSILGSETRELPFDLTLRVEGRPRGLQAVLEYRSQLFDRTRMHRLLEQFELLLSAAVTEPDRSLAAFSLLSAAQRQQTLVEWNDVDRDRSAAPEATVHGLFEAQAARTPSATAARFEGERLTYAQLEGRANRMARRLRALGVSHDDAVGLLIERSLDLVVAVVAILKAGAGYLPLDPGYPAERLAFMIEDAAMPVLVTSGELADGLPVSRAKVLRLDADRATIAAESSEPLSLQVAAESLCYAIFTSGSTGRPKGTLVTHRAVHNRMLWLQETYGLAADDRVLQKTPISFDVSVWEIFWPLTSGASLVLARPGGHMDAAYLLDLLIEAGVTTLHFVPSMLRIFLAQPGVERLRSQGRVRRVVASGEALTFDLQQAFFERFGRTMPLHNMYGPSEAARASYYPVDPKETHSVVPIGRPVANDRIYLVDSSLRPVALGIPGELTIGGIGLARGYHRRAGLTAAKFLPDPFATTPGARLYRTGDLTRTLADGAIEFLGRIDHQVKVRGMRVELGEIDAALESHPAIRDAVVVVREVTAGDQRLVAYLVAHDGPPPIPELRRCIAERLPDYMLPTSFVVLEAMPLTPSGKVDRKALPAPDSARPELEETFVAPRSSLEESLVGIFAAVLGVDRVGIHDDFFALGGHSLLATQIVSRVRDNLQREVPLRTLFEFPTVASWAERIEGLEGDTEGAEVPPLVPVARVAGKGMALSFAQQRLWFLDRLVPDNPFYNMFTGFRLTGAVEFRLLDRAFQEIVRRHEILRTVFVEEGDEPLQVLLPEPFRLPLPLIDLSALPRIVQDGQLGRLAARESQRTFELATGPLLRVHAVRLGARSWALLINIHHINSDGWSTGVFYRELVGLYRAYAAGEPSPFEPLKIQYADFAAWQRGWLSAEALDRQVAYWAEQLADAPATLTLPMDHRRPEFERFVGGMAGFHLEPDLVEGLNRYCREQGVTLFMATLAVFNALLYRYSGQEDILVGSGIANRTYKELEGLIGFFVNTLVMRTRIRPRAPFADLMDEVRKVALEAYSHQDLPFERLIDELKIERSLASNPLCQVGFVVQNYPVRFDSQDLAEIQVGPLGTGGVDTGTSKFDLTVYLREIGGWISCGIEYSSDLFERTTVRRMARHYATLLASVVEDPSRALLDLPMLERSERQQLVGEWARNEKPYPRQASIPALFAEVVRRRPEARAVTCASGNLTYGELNRVANRLAHKLRRMGVGPEVRVAVGVERSASLVVAILAILKAGGGYVPLDLSLPASRLAHILRQADPALMVVRPGGEEGLPEVSFPLLTLEEGANALDGESEADPEVAIEGENLAYIVFTSGSTGRPKGVAALHRGVVRLVRETDYTSFGEDEVFSMLAPPSFDASTFELWAPLLNGGQLAIFPAQRPSLEELGKFLATAGVTTLWITVGLFHQMVDVCLPQLAGVRQILTGGDVVSPVQVAKVLAASSGTTMISCYGPTENTTFTSSVAMHREAGVRTPLPIGVPIAHGGVLVLDRSAQPTPVGVIGSLFTTGDGLARGYFAQPGLTAERFVPNPVATQPGERMYDTGDRASWSGDGLLNFHGRDDNQVKIRGFRIELEEIERALRSHSAVRDAAVLARQDEGQDKRLVAYVVQDTDYVGEQVTDEAVEGEQVDEWGMLFDDLYKQNSPLDDPTFNIIGWDSTYTGEPLPVEEMREWLDDTIDRIAAEKPRRIFEIGCGTGMLLFRLAPQCERYLGTDLSQEAIDYLERTIGDRLPQVELACQPADLFEGIEDGSFDTMILNSVVQYFPTAEYLAEVIAGAQRVLAPGGRFFLGDLRSQPLNEPFATDVELFQAPPEATLDKLRLAVQRRLAQENELTVAPAFFAGLKERLPALERVEIHPKFGKAHNELTAYRYQAVLRFAGSEEAIPTVSPAGTVESTVENTVENTVEITVEIDGRDEAVDLAFLGRQLARNPDLVIATDLANVRVVSGVGAVALLSRIDDEVATVDDLRGRLLASPSTAIDPADLAALAAERGYELELGWAAPGADGRFDAVLRPARRAGGPRLASWLREPRPATGNPELARYCSRPLQGRFLRGAVPALRAYLGTELPDYMVPSLFVLMEELPLNEVGKIDRRALPDPQGSYDPQGADYVAPRSEIEVQLATIWREVLGLDKVGLHDDFFALGGHSLLATRVVSRLRGQFEVELPLRVLFEARELAGLASYLEALLWARETPAAAGSDAAAAVGETTPESEAVEEWEI